MKTILITAAVIGCAKIIPRIVLDGVLGTCATFIAVETLWIVFVGMLPLLAATTGTPALSH